MTHSICAALPLSQASLILVKVDMVTGIKTWTPQKSDLAVLSSNSYQP